jgi:hypothetical protein
MELYRTRALVLHGLVLWLWGMGFDTARMAELLMVPEAEVSAALHWGEHGGGY